MTERSTPTFQLDAPPEMESDGILEELSQQIVNEVIPAAELAIQQQLEKHENHRKMSSKSPENNGTPPSSPNDATKNPQPATELRAVEQSETGQHVIKDRHSDAIQSTFAVSKKPTEDDSDRLGERFGELKSQLEEKMDNFLESTKEALHNVGEKAEQAGEDLLDSLKHGAEAVATKIEHLDNDINDLEDKLEKEADTVVSETPHEPEVKEATDLTETGPKAEEPVVVDDVEEAIVVKTHVPLLTAEQVEEAADNLKEPSPEETARTVLDYSGEKGEQVHNTAVSLVDTVAQNVEEVKEDIIEALPEPPKEERVVEVKEKTPEIAEVHPQHDEEPLIDQFSKAWTSAKETVSDAADKAGELASEAAETAQAKVQEFFEPKVEDVPAEPEIKTIVETNPVVVEVIEPPAKAPVLTAVVEPVHEEKPSVVESVKETAASAWETTKETTGEAVEKTKQVASSAAESVSSAAQIVVDTTTETTKKAAEAVSSAAHTAVEKTGEALSSVSAATKEVVKDTAAAADKVATKVEKELTSSTPPPPAVETKKTDTLRSQNGTTAQPKRKCTIL